MRIADAVEALTDADLVGFSTYVWNGRISLEIARRLKALSPGIVIVFGGPHVPDQPEAFLRANPQIDLAVHNEGERTFLKLLEGFPDREAWQSLPGVSMVKADGSFVRNPNIDRVRDLDEIPSPFLEGAFDSIMAANPSESWIGLWETNRGCPFRCTFCDWGSATAAKVTKFGEERLYREVDWFADKKIEYIFCCDANFGIQKRDVDIAKYVAGIKQETGYPVALSVQNTKNATERAYETQKILSDAGLNKGVALSMQSVDMTTLEAIKRDNISLGTYMELQRRFTRDKVETYSDLILGLPGETYEFVRQGRRPADRERPAQPHPVQQPVDPAQRRDGRSGLPGQVRHGHGRVQDHQHPRRAHRARRRRAGSPGPRRRDGGDAAGRLAAHAHLLLDDGAAALRQAVPDSADPGARHLGHRLPRHDRGLHGGRSQAISR